RPWPQVHPCSGAQLHLVELPRPGLGSQRSRPPPRSYVVLSNTFVAGHRPPGAGTVPRLGAAVGPCPVDPRAVGVTEPSPIERAIAALQAGGPVRIGEVAVLSVETASQAMLELLDPKGCAPMLLSGPRAAALGLANEREAASPNHPVEVSHCEWLERRDARSR